MANTTVNKVVLGGEVLIDLTADTVTAGSMLSGTKAHDKSGTVVTGAIAKKTSSDMTVSGATVTAPAGYYETNSSKSVASGSVTVGTPTINSSTGVVTGTASVSAGYVSGTPTSKTLALSTQAAKTITPTTTNQIAVAAGKYTIGAVTVAGDADLISDNIKSGVNIFGVIGKSSVVDTSDTTATAENIFKGKTAYVNGSKITGVAEVTATLIDNDDYEIVMPEGLVTIE